MFGQNFLTDKRIAKEIVKASNLKSTDIVLEIGPGEGALTKEIFKFTKNIIAVEKDKRLIKNLEEKFPEIKIVNEDILKFEELPKKYKIIANLPFYATSPIIRKFLNPPAGGRSPQEMVLIIQKEVAQRITAKPPKMSILAISVQLYAKARILSYISKKSFKPQPNVDAAIIKLTLRDRPGLSPKENDHFFKIVKAGFSAPRKQLINNLSKGLKIEKELIQRYLKQSKIDPERRAETLDVKDWKKLASVID